MSALQYLPDIVQLQTSLYEKCHHCIDQDDAKISLERFIKNYVAKGMTSCMIMLNNSMLMMTQLQNTR